MSMQFMMVEDEPEQSIPLPTPEEEQEMSRSSIPDELPILTLRNTVLFPGVVLPITIGRDASLQLVRDAFSGDKLIGVVAQRKSNIENPDPEELYHVGTVATVLRLLKMPDGSKSIVIQGKRRFRIDEFGPARALFPGARRALPGDTGRRGRDPPQGAYPIHQGIGYRDSHAFTEPAERSGGSYPAHRLSDVPHSLYCLKPGN